MPPGPAPHTRQCPGIQLLHLPLIAEVGIGQQSDGEVTLFTGLEGERLGHIQLTVHILHGLFDVALLEAVLAGLHVAETGVR